MIPAKSYTIWFSQRTGSSLLTTTLEATGVAGRPREWLNVPAGTGLLQQYGVKDGASLADALREQGTTENRVFGAKVSWWEPRMCEAFALFRQMPGCQSSASRAEVWAHVFPNHHHIFMMRRNKVRLAVSWWRAIQSRHWHRRVNGTGEDDTRVPDVDADYDFEAITQLVAESVMREAGIQEFFSEAGVIPLTLVYEDFVQDYDETVRRIFQMLELDHVSAIPAPVLQPIADNITEVWVQRYRQERQSGWLHVGW